MTESERERVFFKEGPVRISPSVKKEIESYLLKLNTRKLFFTLESTVLVVERTQETDLILINDESK